MELTGRISTKLIQLSVWQQKRTVFAKNEYYHSCYRKDFQLKIHLIYTILYHEDPKSVGLIIFVQQTLHCLMNVVVEALKSVGRSVCVNSDLNQLSQLFIVYLNFSRTWTTFWSWRLIVKRCGTGAWKYKRLEWVKIWNYIFESRI